MVLLERQVVGEREPAVLVDRQVLVQEVQVGVAEVFEDEDITATS